ncbi:hypothetical protein EFL38_12400 [Lactococcus cremoris]|nr:hypothetical protein [Lactococcus cremoris]MCT0501781.1 hypothetical protein [Lactococcus cremoris]RQE14553.1 hypothetical protein D6113_02845 [Lactococcus lactis]
MKNFFIYILWFLCTKWIWNIIVFLLNPIYKVPNNWFFDWGVQFVVIAIPIYLIFNKLGLFDNNSKTKK